MTTVEDFNMDGSTPDHEGQVSARFADLAHALADELGQHPAMGDVLSYLAQARDLALGIARDNHTDTAGHPGDGASARAASHEPVPLSEQGGPVGSAAMASSVGAVGGEPTDAPTGPASGAGTYYTAEQDTEDDTVLTDCPDCQTRYAPDLEQCPHCGADNPELRTGALDAPVGEDIPATPTDVAADGSDVVRPGEPVTLEKADTTSTSGS